MTPYHYKMLRSASFYKKFLPEKTKSKNNKILRATVHKIKTEAKGCKVYTDKGNYSASKVFSSLFDPKSLISQSKFPVLKQHFIGWFIKAPKGSFDPDKILFMDFNIPQSKQTRFLYVLPQDDQNALVEYTVFSKELLKNNEYEKGIEKYLTKIGVTDYKIEEKEHEEVAQESPPHALCVV